MADFGKAQVGVVLAEQQTIFGAGGEHAIRLGRSLGDQIVNQNADVGLVAAKDDRLADFELAGRH